MKVLKFILIIFCIFNFVKADWSIDLSTNSGFTNNLTNNYKNLQDEYIAPKLRLSSYGNNFVLYYKGSSTQLINNTKYNRYKQNLGVNYYEKIGENINLYSGGRALWRKNKTQYSYYDYLDSKIFVNLKIYLSKRTYMKTGVVSNYKNFFEVDAWEHFEHNLWTMLNASLPTRTTLRGYFSYKNRNFLPYQDTSGQTQEINTLWLLEGSFRIAQSISRNIGGYTEINYQYSPSRESLDTLNFSSFSPIDDYFGYIGWDWQTNLKIRYLPNFTTTLNLKLFQKEYLKRTKAIDNYIPGVNVDDSEAEDNIINHGYKVNLSAEYEFQQIFGESTGLLVVPYVFYKWNDSNTQYFTYDEIGGGVNLTYLMDF